MIRTSCRPEGWPRWSLAQSCRLGELVGEKLTLKATGGGNARLKVPALVLGFRRCAPVW